MGPILGYTVVSCKFVVNNIDIASGTSDTMIASAIIGAVQVKVHFK